MIPQRLEGRDCGERTNVSLLSTRRPTIARRAVVDVDVVVVSRFERDQVVSCLNNLAIGTDGAVTSVTVVDNGSNDGTCEAVAVRGDGTRVLDMGFDTGLATAANAGMARGRGRYILVLDPNTTMMPGAVRTLVEFADRHPEAGVVAPRMVPEGGSGSVLDAAGETAIELDWASSRAMLVPRVVHAVTAGFDEDYVTAWADRDWCRRIRGAGYSVWCVPAATATYQPRLDVGRSQRRALLRDHFAGAHRYWLRHEAPPQWHPWHWIGSVSFAARGALAAVPATDPSPRPAL